MNFVIDANLKSVLTVSTFCWDYFQVALTSTANLQEHHANAI